MPPLREEQEMSERLNRGDWTCVAAVAVAVLYFGAHLILFLAG